MPGRGIESRLYYFGPEFFGHLIKGKGLGRGGVGFRRGRRGIGRDGNRVR